MSAVSLSSLLCKSNSVLKWLLAIDSAVCRGGASSSISERGDLPIKADPFTKDAEDDLREGDARDGVRSREGVTPPTP